MTRLFRTLIASLPLLAFASCGQPDVAAVEEINSKPPQQTYAAVPAPGEELPPSQTTEGPIPLDYRYVWAIEPGDCTNDPALTRIAIAPGAVKFYEGRSEVISADTPHDGALVLNISHTSEGQTTNETHVLALDDAKTTLTYKRGENSFTYKRCD